MRHGWTLLLCLWLAACAQAPIAPRADHLFEDGLFAPPSEPIRADDVFALSDSMKRYLDSEIAPQLRRKGPRDGLIDALYTHNQLKLEYDSAMTRNASQAFDARAGNCLSLVIMTAAFAKQLGLPVRFQSVFVTESWTRNGGIDFSSGHVNLSLGRRFDPSGYDATQVMTIDFLPQQELRGQRGFEIAESTIVAMFMNNRSAEALVRGQLDDAYWWAREAIAREPTFLSSYNTLAVVYLRHGQPEQARQVLERVLEREPANTASLSNLARTLEVQGRADEARAVRDRLARIEPVAPFHYFDLGLAAMKVGDYKTARTLFVKEIDREAYYHEFHFWLALADFGLGDLREARKHMDLAMQTSTTRTAHDLYAAKLDRINAYRLK